MATYNRESLFAPSSVQSQQVGLQVFKKQADLMARGEAMVRSKYKNILDLSLTHTANQEKLSGFMKESTESMNQQLKGSDLSDLNQVKDILGTFDPLTNDPQYASILKDHQYTEHYKREFAAVDSYRTDKDKDGVIGKNYSEYNEQELHQMFTKFRNSDGSDPGSWGSAYEYKPYYDNKAEERELTKEFLDQPDEFTVESVNAEGIQKAVTIKGKTPDQLRMYLDATLSERAKSQIKLQGRVIARSSFDKEGALKSLQTEALNNISTLDKQLKILKEKGTDRNGRKLTPAEKKVHMNNLDKQKLASQDILNQINDPKGAQALYSKFPNIYASQYLNGELNRMSAATANRTISTTYDTNSARVHSLNRHMKMQQFIATYDQDERAMKMDFLNSELNRKASKDIAMIKAGIDPNTGRPLVGLGAGGEGLPSPLPILEQDEKAKIAAETKKKHNATISETTNDMISVLDGKGLLSVISEDGEIDPSELKKGYKIIGDAYRLTQSKGEGSEYQRIMGMSAEQLAAAPKKDRAMRVAIQEVEKDISKVGVAVKYGEERARQKRAAYKTMGDALSTRIDSNRLKGKGDIVTLARTIDPTIGDNMSYTQLARIMNEDDKDRLATVLNYDIESKRGDIITEIDNPIATGGILTAAPAVGGLILGGSKAINAIGKAIPIKTNIKDVISQQVEANMIDHVYESGNQISYSVPQGTNLTPADKSRRNDILNKVDQLIVQHRTGVDKDVIEDLEDITDSYKQIVGVQQRNEGYVVQYRKLSNSGKLVDEVISTKVIPKNNINILTNPGDSDYYEAMKWDKDGESTIYSTKTKLSSSLGLPANVLGMAQKANQNFKIVTSSGTRLGKNSEKGYFLGQVDINKDGNYETVVAGNTPFDVESKIALQSASLYNNITQLVQEDPEFNGKNESQIRKKIYKTLVSSNRIYTMWNLQNPSDDPNEDDLN